VARGKPAAPLHSQCPGPPRRPAPGWLWLSLSAHFSLWTTWAGAGTAGEGARGPFPGVPVSAPASRGLPRTVYLVEWGIVLVEAFGHVQTSHFRATFRLELGSQQRGAQHGQSAKKRGQAEPCHGAGRGGRAPTFGIAMRRDGKQRRGAGDSRVERGRRSWSW
jgi:hypothetical protein